MHPVVSLSARRGLVVAMTALALVGTGCRAIEVASGDGVANPVMVDPPVAVPAPGQEPKVDPDAQGATEVERNPDAQSVQPVAWEKVSFDRANSQLQVWWWSGVEPCTALSDVTVEFRDDDIVVTVLEGMPPEAAAMSCVAMAQYKTYSVALSEDPGSRPFVDGAA